MKNSGNRNEILKMENQKMQNDSSMKFGLKIVQGNHLYSRFILRVNPDNNYLKICYEKEYIPCNNVNQRN